MRARTVAALLAPLLAAGCAAMSNNTQGPLEPQSVAGPCQVERFFTLGQRSVPVRMSVANTGQACSFTMFNPALNLTLNAAFVTGPAARGTAAADLANGRRQVAVAYTPAPGYAGPDRFSVTWEPGGSGVTVDVTVQPAR
jgi:hypothetical protein